MFIELFPLVTTPQPLVESTAPPSADGVASPRPHGGAPQAETRAGFLDAWLTEVPHGAHANVKLLTERPSQRTAAVAALCAAVKDHFIGLDVLSRMRFPLAAAVVDQRLPRGIHIRSGDLGEVIATEYVLAKTEFRVPLKKLRFKDDRELAMRGDDIIGLHATRGTPAVLKAEVKSRAALPKAVVGEACASLEKNRGRPKSETLAFIALQLRATNRDDEAEQVEHLLDTRLGARDIAHVIFTMSGNDPAKPLAAHAAARRLINDRRLVGLHVNDHQSFIHTIFETVRSSLRSDGGSAPPTSPVAPPDATAP